MKLIIKRLIHVFEISESAERHKMPALDIHMIESLSRELHPTSDLMSETEVSTRILKDNLCVRCDNINYKRRPNKTINFPSV